MSKLRKPTATGRGSQLDPPNRFGGLRPVADLEQVEHDEEYLRELERPQTEFLPDTSRSIVSENNSPDVGFRYSLNPYRGCEHGCAYCYARPYHEYLGLNAGLDFETKIFVKERAPELFRDWLGRDSWRPEPIAFSGVTDCYQPAERQFGLTRSCLEVARESWQPITIVTKNALVTRDLDILGEMATRRIVHVAISVTTLDEALARRMEPRTSTPSARLRTIERLSEAGVPVRVMVAPVIPGLNDHEIPAILQAARKAGAWFASYVLLRLPLTVRPIFLEWLRRVEPSRSDRVESLIRTTREGDLNSSEFGVRMCGSGPLAEQIRRLFAVSHRRGGFNTGGPELDTTQFRPPKPTSGQLRLF